MGIGSVAGGAEAAVAGGAPSAATGAGFAAGQGVVKSLDALVWSSVILMIVGILHYILKVTGYDSLTVPTLILAFVVSIYAVSEKAEVDRWAVLMPILFFCVWYFLFGATKGDFAFWTYIIGAFGILTVLSGVFTKGKSVKPELYGLLPPLFLFLDMGLVAFVQQEFSLSVTKIPR